MLPNYSHIFLFSRYKQPFGISFQNSEIMTVPKQRKCGNEKKQKRFSFLFVICNNKYIIFNLRAESMETKINQNWEGYETSSHCAMAPGQMAFHLSNVWIKTHFIFHLIVLLLAQFFAIMPIYGITTKSAKELKFTWLNLRVLHSAVLLFCVTVMIILSLIWAASNKLTIPILGILDICNKMYFLSI